MHVVSPQYSLVISYYIHYINYSIILTIKETLFFFPHWKPFLGMVSRHITLIIKNPIKEGNESQIFLLLLIFGSFVFRHSGVKFQYCSGPGSSVVRAFLKRLRQEIVTQSIRLNGLDIA